MRTKKTLLNFLTDVIPLCIISLLGIFKLKIFIDVLGNETLGLYQLFSQIMIYIALVDGGISNAVLYSMYKPNSENDNNKIKSILLGSKRTFSLIGIVVFLLAFLFSFLTPFLIKDAIFTNSYITFTFLLFSLSNVISYFFVPYQILLEVKEKKHIVNLCMQIGQIMQTILEIVLLLAGVSFPIILFMHSMVKLSANLATYLYYRKKYKSYDFKDSIPDYSFKKEVKSLLFHKINGLVGSNIDVILISKFIGLTATAVYSAYNYIINMLKMILGKISSSMLALIGNYVVKEKENSEKLYLEINSMMFFVATIISVPLLFALNSFIRIWYEGSIAISNGIAIAFTLTMFVFLIKTATTLFINANGLFKETRYCALTDTIINLVFSFTLIWKYGIFGVVIATAISVFIAEYILKTLVLYKNVFKKKPISYFQHNSKYFVIVVIDALIGFLLFNNIFITNIIMWFIIFIIYFIINTGLIMLIYYFMKDIDFFNRLKSLLERG